MSTMYGASLEPNLRSRFRDSAITPRVISVVIVVERTEEGKELPV
jgi:hypothetical protein